MKINKLVLQILCSLILGCFLSVPVLAEEIQSEEENKNIQGTLMMTELQTEGRKQPSFSAEVTAVLPAGTYVLVTGEEDKGWYEIYYQGENLFVPEEFLTLAELDAKALDDEMKKTEEVDRAFIESLEIQRKAIARSKIWRAVIIILIIGVFVTGIISSRKGKDKTRE